MVWDPFLAAVQRQSAVRVIADGRGEGRGEVRGQGDIASYQRYYLASTPFAQARPDVLQVLFAELKKAGQWVKQSPQDAAALLAPVWGLDVATVEQANSRRSYDVRAVQPGLLAEQQRIADAFLSEKLLPRRVNALDVALFKPGA